MIRARSLRKVSSDRHGSGPTGPLGRRGVRAVVAGLVLFGVTTLTVAPASADTTTTTSTVAPTTTSTVPPTTTTSTVAPTTSTVAPTTTSRPSTTTTSSSTTTTTTAPLIATPTKHSGTVWLLIVLLVVIVLVIVLLLVFLQRRKSKQAASEWRRSVSPALDDARLARESLLSPNAVSDDPELRGSVEVQVDRASRALEQAATGAPDEIAQGAASTVASSLRGLAFAIEADRLLRHGAGAPSGAQLAQADEAKRARLADLDTAISRLGARVSVDQSGSRRR